MPNLNEIAKAIKDKSEKYYDRTLSLYENEIFKQYKTALSEVRKLIRGMYAAGYEATFEEMNKYNRLVNLEKAIQDELRKLSGEQILFTKDVIKDSFYKEYLYTAYTYSSLIKSKVTFGLLDTETVNSAIFNKYDLIKWPERVKKNINDLNNRIKNAVVQGLIKGQGILETTNTLSDNAQKKSMVEMERAIKDRFGKTYREAQRIIRTETRRAQTEGNIVAYDKAKQSADRLGINVRRRLVATFDKRTRRQSALVDGELSNDEGLFRYPDGGYYAGPGLTGRAKWDINDRETVITHFEDIPYKYRRENIDEKEIIKDTNFQKWAQAQGITKNIYGEKVIK